MARATLTGLPEEILLQILSLLEPPELTRLQLTSRVLRSLARDDNLWRARCFDQSLFLETLDRRRRIHALIENEKGQDPFPQPGFPLGLGHNGSIFGGENEDHESRKRERVRIMANWDPSYPSEKVSWYDEYIQRHAPIAVSWLQQPQIRDGSLADVIEARGLALYRPNRSPEQNGTRDVLYAVSPLDDGSVCLWDVNGTEGRRGAVVSKSRPGILFIDGPSADNSRRSKRVDSGVTECVAVDSVRHRAYFAVQSRMYQNPQHPTMPSCTPLTRVLGPDLIEVDLQRLSVVGCESFPWSITALSTAHHNLPLTVGTSLGIHMHDFRAPSSLAPDPRDGIDEFDVMGAQEYYERSLRVIFDDDPLPPYAPLSQPGPLSILHLQRPGAEADISDDVFVAGRFSNILHYDRRKFPSIQGSIHSGARLCAMTSLPFPYSTVDSELRRAGQLSVNKVAKSKSMTGGRTLIACGEYNTKGSLELYGLSPSSEASTMAPGGLQQSTLKNRQTSSQSKLLSVANHGTRLVFSDGSGLIKWFERDGCTEVRRHRIGHCEGAQGPSLFASMPGSDDIARKILCTSSGVDNGRVNDNDLLFWTGEKLGLVGFSSQPGFKADDFEEVVKTAEEEAREAEERQYHDRMRQALERQADDVRLVTNLGFGTSV